MDEMKEEDSRLQGKRRNRYATFTETYTKKTKTHHNTNNETLQRAHKYVQVTPMQNKKKRENIRMEVRQQDMRKTKHKHTTRTAQLEQ
jgi:hypothetical protein